jgi:hypothetical protein
MSLWVYKIRKLILNKIKKVPKFRELSSQPADYDHLEQIFHIFMEWKTTYRNIKKKERKVCMSYLNFSTRDRLDDELGRENLRKVNFL